MKAFARDSVIVLLLMGWLLSLVNNGSIRLEFVVIALVGLVILSAFARNYNPAIAERVFRIVLPLASLAIFIMIFGQAQFWQIVGSILVLALALFGLYYMVRGPSLWRR
jgi:hypothetical protein